MLGDYLFVLLFLLIAAAVACVALSAARLLGPKAPSSEKSSAYECGFTAISDARHTVDVRFCLIAILFVIFDCETAFLFPWAVSLRHVGPLGFWSMMLFLTVLLVGFIYEWRKGALNWV